MENKLAKQLLRHCKVLQPLSISGIEHVISGADMVMLIESGVISHTTTSPADNAEERKAFNAKTSIKTLKSITTVY